MGGGGGLLGVLDPAKDQALGSVVADTMVETLALHRIAFQTFDSPVMIRAIRVEGTVALSQWRALLLENAQKTLWNRP